jgi:uncharacterized repeat protein (TIGR01451 family)
MMTRASKLLGATGLSVLAALGATPAMAAGTQAGNTIQNTATVSYSVGGVAQTNISASDTFTVDRKINVTVAQVGTTTTVVAPGQTDAVTTFTVTNTSNATLDFAINAAQLATGIAGANGGTDSFNGTDLRVFVESDGVAGYSAGDTAVTYLDELAADQQKTVYVLLNIPANQTNNGVAGVVLAATAREGGTSGSQGAVILATVGGNTAQMDTVFADAAGAVDAARDATHSAKSDYTVSAATLSANKSSLVLSDPVNGALTPKMIPGATVQYCIAVSNALGGATATGVNISDLLPAQTTFDSSYPVKVGGTTTLGACNLDGANTGTFANGTVSGSLGNILPGTTKTVVFRVTVN